MAVKLLLLDHEDRLLLVRGRDPRSGDTHWCPVGGGVEAGESLQDADSREADEETGLGSLPQGTPVWTRQHTYEFDGRSVEVHEDWLLHRVDRFEPAPTGLSDHESRSIRGFRWWHAAELSDTVDSVFPPHLGELLARLLLDGPQEQPVDITDRAAP